MKVTYEKWLKSPFGTQGLPPENPRLIDGFNGMSTHMGHVMPKRTMSKNMEKTY